MAPTTPNINAPAKLGNPGASNLSSPAVGEIHFACAATTAWGRHSLAALARSSSASLGERRALPVPIGLRPVMSHSKIVESLLPLTRLRPSGRTHAADIAPVALETRINRPVAASHRCSERSTPPPLADRDATSLPSAEKAITPQGPRCPSSGSLRRQRRHHRRRTALGRLTAGFFLPVRILSRVFRGKFVADCQRFQPRHFGLVRSAGDPGRPSRPRHLVGDADRQGLGGLRRASFGGPAQVLKYLARYTHRVAISNARLLDLRDGRVTFRYKDYADGHKDWARRR